MLLGHNTTTNTQWSRAQTLLKCNEWLDSIITHQWAQPCERIKFSHSWGRTLKTHTGLVSRSIVWLVPIGPELTHLPMSGTNLNHCQHHDLISHPVTLTWHWGHQSLPHPNNAEYLARKRQITIFKSLAWLGQGSTTEICQSRTWIVNSFGHPDWYLADPFSPDWYLADLFSPDWCRADLFSFDWSRARQIVP